MDLAPVILQCTTQAAVCQVFSTDTMYVCSSFRAAAIPEGARGYGQESVHYQGTLLMFLGRNPEGQGAAVGISTDSGSLTVDLRHRAKGTLVSGIDTSSRFIGPLLAPRADALFVAASVA
jgi:hypothetical protein